MIEMSGEIKEIAAALMQFQGMVDGVHKASNNPHFKSRYANLEKVVDTARPALQEVGLLFTQSSGDISDGNMQMTTMIIHASSGQWMRYTMWIPLGKKDPQGAGSAQTYAQRYSLMAALGLPPTDDDAETAIDRNNVRPEPVEASKNDAARETFTRLQKDFRTIKDTDQLKLWWRDNSSDIDTLPIDWAKNIRSEWLAHGVSLKEAKDTVHDIQEQFPGAKVVSDNFVENFINGEPLDDK